MLRLIALLCSRAQEELEKRLIDSERIRSKVERSTTAGKQRPAPRARLDVVALANSEAAVDIASASLR